MFATGALKAWLRASSAVHTKGLLVIGHAPNLGTPLILQRNVCHAYRHTTRHKLEPTSRRQALPLGRETRNITLITVGFPLAAATVRSPGPTENQTRALRV